MIIAISGTPGTGKTYIAKKLSKIMNGRLEYFDLNKYIKKNKLYDSYDRKDKTFDVDVGKLYGMNKAFEKYIGKNDLFEKLTDATITLKDFLDLLKNKKLSGIIVDSHLSQHIDSDYCIIVKSSIKNINARLKKRNYGKTKIRDNVESEIFDICLEEAKALKRRIIIVDNL